MGSAGTEHRSGLKTTHVYHKDISCSSLCLSQDETSWMDIVTKRDHQIYIYICCKTQEWTILAIILA